MARLLVARTHGSRQARAKRRAAPAVSFEFRGRLPGQEGSNRHEGGGTDLVATNTARNAPEAERKTLRDLRFQTGDFIDCAIHFPKINGPGGQYVGPWGQLEPPESPGADASSPT